MSGGKDSAVTFELAKLVAAEGPSAPQMLLAGSGGRMAGNRGLHAGRHACPGGQAVLVPDSLPADQRPFFATLQKSLVCGETLACVEQVLPGAVRAKDETLEWLSKQQRRLKIMLPLQ